MARRPWRHVTRWSKPDPDATPTPPPVDVASHETILPAISSPDAAGGLRRVAGNRKLYHNLLTRCIVG
ncbi:MAG: hypothetical protein RKO25_07045 [Candidatus Contendobacter sp.]|nr:hypothetical protein [Candidatus Contendobacter sp.]